MKPDEVMNKDPESSKNDRHSPRSGMRLLWFLLIPVLLAISAFFGAQARQTKTQQLGTTTKSLAVQTVNVIHPQRGASSSDLTLPGMIQAFSQSPIYARVDGYACCRMAATAALAPARADSLVARALHVPGAQSKRARRGSSGVVEHAKVKQTV